jgi:outer membrane protein assembly factor BamB
MEMRVEHPGGAWAVRLASLIYDEPRALHWDEGGLFVVGYGFTVYAFSSRSGDLAWLHQTGTPVVALAASPRFDHVIVQSEVETWAIRSDGEVKWRLAHTDVVGAAELMGGQLILTSIAGATQSIDPATGRALT